MPDRNRIYHGVSIGILMLDTRFERFNGDIGNARTWPFPVQYRVVRDAKRRTALPGQKGRTCSTPSRQPRMR